MSVSPASLRTVALFAGNYIARSQKALNPEEIIKVLLQAFTLDKFISLLNKYTPLPGYAADYSKEMMTFLATALSDIAYEALLDVFNKEKLGLKKEDLMKAMTQGLVVAISEAMKLY